jgi:hypothetical protein
MHPRVYTEVHHRAAALMHQLTRVPAPEYANELFGAAASYLTASGAIVTVSAWEAAEPAVRIDRDALEVRSAVEAIRGRVAAQEPHSPGVGDSSSRDGLGPL